MSSQVPLHLQQFGHQREGLSETNRTATATPTHARSSFGSSRDVSEATVAVTPNLVRFSEMNLIPPSTVPSAHTSAVSFVPASSAVGQPSDARGVRVPPPAGQHPTSPDRNSHRIHHYQANSSKLNSSTGDETAAATVSVRHQQRSAPTGGPAAAALAPVMGHLYGMNRSPASAESSPYSYLSRITPILQRGQGEGGGESSPRESRRPSAFSSSAVAAVGFLPPSTETGHPVDAPLYRQQQQQQQQQRDAGMNSSCLDMGDESAPVKESVSAAAAALIAADAARQMYNEKLRGSIEGVMEALAAELPQDHIFLQLMADPVTSQYGKVRLTEIVEGFLYATQAQQYHNLAAELAQREIDNVALAARVAELERWLQAAAHEQTGSRAHDARQSHEDGECTSGTEASPTAEAGAAAAATAPGASPAGGSEATTLTNPMSEEEARRELMAILEATSREQELERCRRALVAPTKLSEVAQAEPNYSEKFEYISAVVSELYRAVHAFMRYADGSLESLEALRNDLAVAEVPRKGSRDDNNNANGSGGFSLAHGSASSKHGTPNVSATSASAFPERVRIHELGEQLRDAHILTARALDRLQSKSADQERQLAQLTRELAEVRAKDSADTATATTEARAMQLEMNEMMREHERTLTQQQQETQRQLDELQRRLRNTQQERSEAQRDCVTANSQIDRLRQELADIHHNGEKFQHEAHNATAELRSELHLCRADLRACEGELACAQVEVCMSTLEALYHESEAAKYDILQRSGFEGTVRALSSTARDVQEELRHATARLHLAETSAREKEVAVHAATEELATLLRTMWEDESVASALQLIDEGSRSEAVAHLAPTLSKERGAEGEKQRGGVPGLNDSGLGNAAAATPWKAIQDVHKLPTTLAGLTTGISYAYRGHKDRVRSWHDALESMRAGLAERDSRIRVLEATEETLKAVLQAEKDQVQQLKRELDAMNDVSPMRELLARQETLLKTVSDERNALQRQWSSLNADYIILERRNGQLHERCAEKEHTNAKLSSLLRSTGATENRSPNSDFRTPNSAQKGKESSSIYKSTAAPTAGNIADGTPAADSSSSSTFSAHLRQRPRFPDSIGGTPEADYHRFRGGSARTPVTIEKRSTDEEATASYADNLESL